MGKNRKGKSEAKLLTVADFKRIAKTKLSQSAYDYYRSGAESESAKRRNRKAFSDFVIWNKVLVDVANVDLETTVLGARVAAPILIAPTAYHRLAHPEGELATARAARSFGTAYVASTLSTVSLEDIASATDGTKWFQLYVHKDRDLTASLAARAEAAGFEALCVTVDTPILGKRLRDERNGFQLPAGLSMKNLETASDDGGTGGSVLSGYVAQRHDASFTWSDLVWLRSLTRLPILLKGVVRVDDAHRAVDHGVAGLIVSNHGGRQLDSAPASLDALPAIAQAVGHQCEVLFDGGVRTGDDLFKALSLGARAVLVGRPVLWGLAAQGETGVHRVLTLLAEDLARTMALSGAPSITAIDRNFVARRSG